MSEGRTNLSIGPVVAFDHCEVEAQNISRRMRKPRIYELCTVLESVAWFWRILGVFPFTIKGPIAARRYEINKFHVVYSFLVTTTYIGSFIWGLRRFTRFFNDNNLLINDVIYALRCFLGMACIAVYNVPRVIRHKELLEEINKMTEQYIILQKMNCLNHERNVKIIRAYAWTTFTVITLLAICIMYLSIQKQSSVAFALVIFTAAQMTRISIVSIFLVLVGIIGLEFRALNRNIKSLATRANASSPKVVLTSNICAENIRLISRVHFHLCAIGKRINCIFNWCLVLNVTMAFVISTTTLYYIFYEIERDREIDYHIILHYILLELIHIVPIIVIVQICNWTTHQEMSAGKLIHEIRVEKIDCQLYEAVKTFSLQLHHQKLELNAGGFFPLNSTLIQTMVATLTSYVVILVQFHPKLS